MKQHSLSFYQVLLLVLCPLFSWAQYTGSGIFEEITSETDLTDGYYVIINEDNQFAMNNTNAGSYFEETAVTLSSQSITNPDESIVWYIETDGGGRSVYNESEEVYLAYTGSGNASHASASVSSDEERWTFSYTDNVFSITNLSSTDRVLRYNSGSPRFACYSSTFGHDMLLYKLQSTSDPVLDASPNTISGINYIENNGPSEAEIVSVSGVNLDETDVELALPTGSDFEISENETSGYTNELTLSSYDGTGTDIYVRLASGLSIGSYTDEITISGGGADNITVTIEGEVTEAFMLPYENGLREQDDWDEATAYGFEFDNTVFEPATGGYVRIPSGGANIVSPTINFTAYGILEASFDLERYGGDSGQELTIFISDDNGATYDPLDSFVVPGSYDTFTQLIDLSSYAATTGKIKFEMTAGGASTRFRDLIIEEVVEIEATTLNFTTQPTNVEEATTMTPAVEVAFVDDNGNVDVSYTGDTNLTATGATFDASATTTVAAVDGVAVFDNLIFTGTVTSVTLTASTTETGITDATSDEFDVTEEIASALANLFITEVSDAVDFANEYIEIYNNNTNAVDIEGAKLSMLPDGTEWEFGTDINAAVIPAKGFLIVTRGGTQANFETEFGALNSNTVLVEGIGSMYFGTGSERQWQMDDGDDFIIDDTETNVAGSDAKVYQNIYTEEFVSGASSDANPGELDYFLFTDGNWINNDAPDNATDTKDAILFEDYTFSSVTAVNTLMLSPDTELTVEDVLAVNGDITNDGSIVFASNSSTTGQLDEFSGTISGVGTVSVQQYIPARRAFRLLSSAVSGQNFADSWQQDTHITGTTDGSNGFDVTTTGNPSLFSFDNAYTSGNNPWEAVPNTTGTNLETGKGYRIMVRGDRTIDLSDNESPTTNTTLNATGTLHTGNYTDNSLNNQQDHFSLVGNPYQAIVDMSSVMSNANNLNPNYYYVWDPNLNEQGGYVAVDLSDGSPSSGDSEANGFLQPGQAFLVTTATDNSASISFAESDKATSENLTDVFLVNNTPHQQLNVSLYTDEQLAEGKAMADAFKVNFVEGENNQVNLKDAPKFGNTDENIGRINNDKLLSIEYRDLPTEDETLPVFTAQYQSSNYTFKIEVAEFEGVDTYLKDNYLDAETLLEAEQENFISFSVDEAIEESIAYNRFEILFKANTLATNSFTSSAIALYPNPVNGQLFIEGKALTEDYEVAIYNLLGQKVLQETFASSKSMLDVSELQSGTYLVKISQDGNTFTKKLIVE